MTDELSRRSEEIIILAPGMTAQWLYEGRILVRTAKSVDRDAVDAFIEFSIQHAHSWPPERPILALTDFQGAAFTPYTVKRMHDLIQAVPQNLHGRSATILPHGVVGDLMKGFSDRFISRKMKQMQLRFFSERATALAWLVEALEPLPEVEK